MEVWERMDERKGATLEMMKALAIDLRRLAVGRAHGEMGWRRDEGSG
jgi:hypothetical protein